jgi:hypothetical protein
MRALKFMLTAITAKAEQESNVAATLALPQGGAHARRSTSQSPVPNQAFAKRASVHARAAGHTQHRRIGQRHR